jgi:nanoRNase/pAp phosphatase (c-di-AMP/oligoRNAs hydrolase)
VGGGSKIRYLLAVNLYLTEAPKKIGELMLKYNGGGHQAAGTCQIEHEKSEATLGALITQINNDG